MKIHALVEGPSERAFLEPWARRFLRGHELKAHPHQGKGRLVLADEPPAGVSTGRGLLDQLPAKLAAFGRCLDPATDRVLVLVDADAEPCAELLENLERLRCSIEPAPIVLFRIAIEELEAFYLGDLRALRRAYPSFDARDARAYRPDSICGTWELFGRVIGDPGGSKVAWAEAMGKVVTTRPQESRSPSFKKLCAGLQRIVAEARSSKARRKRAERNVRTKRR
ncbi:MAG: DUF4276 family protein [Deltaproteobacteria bacterium]|nr:DUF4276 family protein [Deltaproteobacteria bacterium]